MGKEGSKEGDRDQEGSVGYGNVFTGVGCLSRLSAPAGEFFMQPFPYGLRWLNALAALWRRGSAMHQAAAVKSPSLTP